MPNSLDPIYIKSLFDKFSTEFNFEESAQVWTEQSLIFKKFWQEKIINQSSELTQADTDILIRMIDSRARGHQSSDHSIARVYIYQGTWELLFKHLREKENIRSILDKIFHTENNQELISLIDELLLANEGNGNGINGKNANALNALLFLNNPDKFISSVSLAHRGQIMKVFGLGNMDAYVTTGEKIIYSNKVIQEGFKDLYGIDTVPRALSVFLYSPWGPYTAPVKSLWYSEGDRREEGSESRIKISELVLERLSPQENKPRNKVKRSIVFDLERNIIQAREQSFQGFKAEQLVIEEEKQALEKAGRADLAEQVRQVSEENSAEGYDVLSFTTAGEEKHIEVKSTLGGVNHNQFHISRNELDVSIEDPNYYLYIVYDMNGEPEIKYLRNPDLKDPELFDLEPLQYLVKYRAKNETQK